MRDLKIATEAQRKGYISGLKAALNVLNEKNQTIYRAVTTIEMSIKIMEEIK